VRSIEAGGIDPAPARLEGMDDSADHAAIMTRGFPRVPVGRWFAIFLTCSSVSQKRFRFISGLPTRSCITKAPPAQTPLWVLALAVREVRQNIC
jgi:hypothetical protein